MALATMVTALVREAAPWAEVASDERFNDLGGLLFTFTMFWAYTSFMQFLIIWSGNLPHEVTYFLVRSGRQLVLCDADRSSCWVGRFPTFRCCCGRSR